MPGVKAALIRRYGPPWRLVQRPTPVQNRPMSTPLRVRLLGRPAFERGGEALVSRSRKALWLAAYVLHAGGSHSRAGLAALFWGGDGRRHALGSLRVALTKLPPALADCLDIGRDAIGVKRGAAVEVDAAAFAAGCEAQSLEAQRASLALYRGDLFEGVEEEAAAEFADWLMPERARLRTLAHDLHVRVAQRLHAQGGRGEARAVADAWLRRDPGCEAMHKLVMTWLAAESGDLALSHYEIYRRARAVAHGAAPSEEMAAIADRLRRGTRDSADAVPRITAATSFMGRADELAELRALLGDPECRLLTIHGLGGVGKTRLAVALTEMEAGAFADGVHVVPLEGVPDARLFGQTLARACGLQPAGNAAPLELVASFLHSRNTLVLLDNLEHLLGGDAAAAQSLPAQLARLLRETGPRVKFLATSREPLHLQEEWIYELGGLAYPAGADAPGAQDAPAVQFFAQRARQGYVGFSLAAELPNVVQVCQLLEGLPLGLELAASWVRTVPCAGIAQQLRERAAELRTRHVNRPERHHSLAAAVAYSWERLPAEQREALAALGVLVGSFSREAAQHIAHAGLRTLTGLAEKSLLQREPGGRWRAHEVVRQFAWEQPGLSSKGRLARQAAVRRLRDAFYLELLRELRPRLDGAEEPEVLAAIEADGANIRQAWRSAAQAGNAAALDAASAAWFEFLECRSFIEEGLRAAGEWRDSARRAGDAPSAARSLVRLGLFQRFGAQTAASLASLDEAVDALKKLDAPADLVQARLARAFTLFLVGRLDDAEEEASAGIAAAEKVGDALLTASGCRVKGLVLLQSGRREQGRDLQRRALELAAAVGKPSLQAAAHNNLALAENHLGNFRAAEAGYESALAAWKRLHAVANIGRGMHNLGVVATRRGDHAMALARYRDALDVLRKAGDRNLIALNLMSTGDALVRLGRPDEARVPLSQSLAMAERDGHMLPALDAHIVLSQAALALGEHEGAARHLVAALDGAARHHFANVLADAVVACARLVAAHSPTQAARARGWADDVARLPQTSVAVREEALRLVEEIAAGGEGRAAPRPLHALVDEARAAVAALSGALRAP